MSTSVALIGAAGGCGTSTLAIGVALASVRAGSACVLLELDLVRGDVAGAFGIPPDRTLADLDAVADELTPDQVASAAHAHRSGLRVLLSPGSPAAPRWGEAEGERLLDAAAEIGTVVVDASAGLTDTVAGAVRAGARPVIVAPSSRAGARRAAALTAELQRPEAAALVLAARPGPREIGRRAAERVAGVPVIAEVPDAEDESASLGVGRWPTRRRARLSRTIEQLAEAVLE